jgi:hypothetical protein
MPLGREVRGSAQVLARTNSKFYRCDKFIKQTF